MVITQTAAFYTEQCTSPLLFHNFGLTWSWLGLLLMTAVVPTAYQQFHKMRNQPHGCTLNQLKYRIDFSTPGLCSVVLIHQFSLSRIGWVYISASWKKINCVGGQCARAIKLHHNIRTHGKISIWHCVVSLGSLLAVTTLVPRKVVKIIWESNFGQLLTMLELGFEAQVVNKIYGWSL